MPPRHDADDRASATGGMPAALDPRCLRPAGVDTLRGQASKVRRELGRVPRAILVDMVNEPLREVLDLTEWQRLVRRDGVGVAGHRS